MQLSTSILSEEVSGTAILLRVLVRYQGVEDRHDLRARIGHRQHRNDEDEVVASDVTDESVFGTDTFYHIVEDLRENSDHTIAVVITIPIVEFFEVIQVRVANGERCFL